MQKPPKIYVSHKRMEQIKKTFETRGLKFPDRKKYKKSKKVVQKSKHTTENSCSVCRETNWMLLSDGRKYCFKCGGVDTDKKPDHEPSKGEPIIMYQEDKHV